MTRSPKRSSAKGDIPAEDSARRSIAQLLGSLTAGQLWAVGGALAALLTGTFGFGYWVSDQGAKVQSSELQRQLGDAISSEKRSEDQLSAMRLKERILGQIALYYSFERDAAAAGATADDRQKFQDVKTQLFQTVMEFSKKTLEGEAKPPLRARLGKGVKPTVLFEFDGSEVPLPPVLFAAAD